MPLVEKTEELVVTAPQGMEGSGAAEVPLAHQRGCVTGFPQPLGQGSLVRWQPDLRVGVGGSDRVALEAEAGLVAPGDHRRTGRRADRRRHVAVGEAHALGGETVEVGRGHVAPSLAARFTIAEVVGDEQDKVRPRSVGARRRT